MKTHVMTWNHTRTGRPMRLVGTMAEITIRLMMIRTVHPKHPISIDGKPFE